MHFEKFGFPAFHCHKLCHNKLKKKHYFTHFFFIRSHASGFMQAAMARIVGNLSPILGRLSLSGDPTDSDGFTGKWMPSPP